MHVERDQVRTLLATGVLAAAFIAAMWLPHDMKDRQLKARIEAARQSADEDRTRVVGLAELSTQVASLRNEVQGSQRYIAAEEEIPSMLRELSRELEIRQVAEQEIQTQTAIQGNGYMVLPISMKFKGSLDTAMGFLSKLESMRQVVRVVRFEMGRDSDPKSTLLTARVELSAFYSPSEAARR